MNIHHRATRLVVSIVVLLIVLMLVVPHLTDVHPPVVVDLLLKPTELLARVMGRLIKRCNNIGTPEHPICEATPIDLFVGLAFVLVGILLYPAMTYLLLSLLAKILRRKAKSSSV